MNKPGLIQSVIRFLQRLFLNFGWGKRLEDGMPTVSPRRVSNMDAPNKTATKPANNTKPEISTTPQAKDRLDLKK